MPNAHVKKSNYCQMPMENNGFLFEFLASSKYDDLVFTKSKEENFFLQVIDKKKIKLIKADKITKPTNVKIVQDAIKSFIDANNFEILYENINSSKNHLKKKSNYQKDIFYFDDYKSNKKIEIEIGFGSGRHILHLAKKFPDREFIGIEIHKPSIEQLLKQCRLQNIKNIFVVDFDARILLQMFSSNSVDTIYIHFPVPWDKKPHRRVISKEFLNESIRVLKKNGKLELRSDSEKYFEYSRDLFLSLQKCEIVIRKNNDIEISSKYEDRWKKMEKNIYDIILTNKEISKEKEKLIPEKFEKEINFSNIYSNFSNKIIRENDFFVHFENIYKIDNNSGVIKISFGSFDKSEHRYLMITNNQINYLPNKFAFTKQNILSDKKIKEYLYETSKKGMCE